MKVKGIVTRGNKKTGEVYLILDKKGMRIEEVKKKKKNRKKKYNKAGAK